MSPKIVNHDMKRAKIIEFAYSYFARHGIRNSSIDGLLKKLHMSKGTFYHYFSSKDELINSIFDDIAKAYMSYFDLKLKYSKGLENCFEVLFGSYLKNSKENQDFLNIYSEYLLIYSTKEVNKICSVNQKYQDYINKTIKKTILKEIENGSLKKEAINFIPSIGATIDGILIHSCMLENYNLNKELRLYLDSLIKLLKKD